MMDPNSTRIGRYAEANQQEAFVAVVNRVLPCSLAGLETSALYLMLGAFWGLVIFTVLSTGL
jgi:hypothetical protein